MVATPTVPGLVLDRRLGSGDHGDVWRALDLGAVGAVAVLVGRPATSAGAAAREAALLRRIDHANVLRLRSVLDLAEGRRALVMDLAEAGDLPQLVRRLGPLPVGEVATLTIALARALEHVHALGFVHGRLTPPQVLFHSDGRPVLGGLGVASLLAGPADDGPPGYPSPADDVRALGEIVRFALTGHAVAEVTEPFAALVAACTAPDPTSRPSPTRVAAMVWDTARPSPVRLFADPTMPLTPTTTAEPFEVPVGGAGRRLDLSPGGGNGAAHADGGAAGRLARVGRNLALSGRALAVGGVALALAAVGLATALVALRGHLGASGPPDPVARAASPPAGVADLPDVAAAVSTLAAARARALGASSASALAAVDAPGSAALASDTAFVQRLRQAGVTLDGLSFRVADAGVLTTGVSGGRATVTLVAHVSASAYRQLRSDGSVVREVPATPVRTVRLTLVHLPAGWRVLSDG